MGLKAILGSLNDCFVTLENGKRAMVIDDGNVGLDVYVQDQTSDVVDYFLCRDLFELELSAPTVIDSYNVNVIDGSSVVNNTYVCLQESARAFQARVLSGGGTNILTLDTPIDYTFSTLASIKNRSPNLNVDGSAEPVIARLNPAAGVQWDVVRIIGNIITPFANGAPTDSKFGGNAALTKGIVIRKSNGIHHTIFNAKTNEDLKLRTGPSDTVYTPSVANGPYGVGFRRTFNGQDKNGAAIRLDGDEGDELQIIIQDDMTGFSSFKVVAQGHVVED